MSRAACTAWLMLAMMIAVAACSAAPRYGPATWELDPAFERPSEEATEIHVLVWERECSSGSSTTGRMSELLIDYAPDSIKVTITVRRLEGAQSCPLPPGTPSVLQLTEPTGARTLIDGGRQPPAIVHPTAEPTVVAPPPVSMTPADLAGTAWLAGSIAGQELEDAVAPRFQFDWLGRPSGHGFTGCDEFGFAVTFEAGQLSIGDLILAPDGCSGPGAPVEERFLAIFRQVGHWAVDGDQLTLSGPEGDMVLNRALPPAGDPGRVLADTLRDGEWRLIRADNVENLDQLASFDFADALLIATGECGLSSDLGFGPGGAIDIVELGWDTIGGACPVDPRPALKLVLDAVTSGSVEPDGSVVFRGPKGDVVFTR